MVYTIGHCQLQGDINKSFVHTNFLSSMSGPIGNISPTMDGGFIYVEPALTFCSIDSEYRKYDMSSKCFEGSNNIKSYFVQLGPKMAEIALHF